MNIIYFVIGKLNYALPLLCNSTKKQLQQLNSLIIKICRVIIGSPCLKWNSNRLLNKSKLNTIWHMISAQGLSYIHRVQSTKIPQAIYELYQIPTSPVRLSTKIIPKYIPKTKIHYFIDFRKYIIISQTI